MSNHQCWHYDPIDKNEKVNCLNCHHWGWTRCKDEVLLMQRIGETESLMRHNSYERRRGSVRQARQG